MPYLLLGVLALGTGLGVRLGTSEAPVRNRPLSSTVNSIGVVTHETPITRPKMDGPRCSANVLAVAISPAAIATPLDLSEAQLTLTNDSSTACELSSVPIFELATPVGTVIETTHPSKVVVNDVIQPGEPQGADLSWESWCGADPRPLTLRVILPNSGGTISSPYGGSSSTLPTCSDHSDTHDLYALGMGGPGTLFGG